MFKLITTGYFYADGGAMFGAVPKVTWSRSYPVNERNLCVLAMHTGIIETTDGRIIIIDPGVGQDQLKDTPAIFYQFYDTTDLCDALIQVGIRPEDVTDVIFTHLHFDHCGAAIRKNSNGIPEAVFPNAVHWVSRAQYENERNPHPLEAESFLPGNTEILEKAGLLRLVESTIEPYECLRMQLYDGHTPGQIAAYIKDGSSTIVFPGDIIPLASHIVQERISAYDLYPTLSYNGKTEILEKAAFDEQVLVFYHDAYTPCAIIKKVRSSFKINKKVDL
ncbi:MAG: MBL fold metallo-hydrolase [Tannerella sp.]|jgi:glyoxylase-like metal-dependent hydrolase (beta-lactamase superfamily II)|nr:MBL fold metallo-hydrolase [Tannerella sp.]